MSTHTLEGVLALRWNDQFPTVGSTVRIGDDNALHTVTAVHNENNTVRLANGARRRTVRLYETPPHAWRCPGCHDCQGA